jgi:hypothetical protein
MASNGAAQRRRGDAFERLIVKMHREVGLQAERIFQSGMMFKRHGREDMAGDIKIPGLGSAEAKSRKCGKGFGLIERWLGDLDALFLKRARGQPLVVLPWQNYVMLLAAYHRTQGDITHEVPDDERRRVAERVLQDPGLDAERAPESEEAPRPILNVIHGRWG